MKIASSSSTYDNGSQGANFTILHEYFAIECSDAESTCGVVVFGADPHCVQFVSLNSIDMGVVVW